MCHSNIADLPCHSRIILFLFDLTDCSIGKSFFSISFPHLLRNIERFSERTLQICRAVFLLPARSEHISQTRKSQPAEHLFLIHSTKKCTPARYFLVHQYAKTVFQWHPLEVGVFLLEKDKNICSYPLFISNPTICVCKVTNNKLSSILLPLYALFLMIFLSIFTPQYFPF